jgi:hypothetical protein
VTRTTVGGRTRPWAAGWPCCLLLLLPAPSAEARDSEWSATSIPSLVYDQVVNVLDGAARPGPSIVSSVSGHRFVVDHVMQISRDTVVGSRQSQDDTQVEPDIAVDPSDPSILVAVFQQGRFKDGASAAPGYATSHDGGATWVGGPLPRLTTATKGEFPRASDPVVAIGPGGSVYAQGLAVDFNECRSAVAVQRSDDGGLTWHGPVLVQDDRGCRSSTDDGEGPEKSRVFNDKSWITVDNDRESPHYGRVYSTWTRGTDEGRSVVSRYSDDRGATWSKLTSVSGRRTGIGVVALVQPGGDLTLVYMSSDRALFSQTSRDGGSSFGAPVTIGEAAGRAPTDLRSFGLPSAAVDPVTRTMYVTWQDSRWRSDDLNDIALSRSLDGGRAWSDPRRVIGGGEADHLDYLTPDIAATKGVVHLTYATRSNRTGPSRFLRQRYGASLDGGTTYGEDIPLGPPIDLRFAARDGGEEDDGAGKKRFLGDYVGLAVGPGAAHPVWIVASQDGPDPGRLHQTAWSASITAFRAAPGPTRAR